MSFNALPFYLPPFYAAVATNRSSLDNLRKQDLNTFALAKGKGGTLFLTDTVVKLSPEDCQFLCNYTDYDVLRFDSRGRVRPVFQNSTNENCICVTGRCNSNCVMRPDSEASRKNGHDSDIDELLELARYLPSDTPHLTITGGEPFMLGERVFELFAALRQQCPNTDFQLLTNGRIFCVDSYVERLVETLPLQTLIGVPLHGDTVDHHDAITQVNGSFSQTARGIRNLLDARFNVEIRFVASRLSAPHAAHTARLISKQFQTVSSVKLMGLEMMGGAARRKSDVWQPYDQIFAQLKPAIHILLEAGIPVSLYNFPLCAVDRGYWNLCEKSITTAKACNGCEVMDACGGLFAGSIWIAQNDVRPIAGLRRM